MHYKIKEIWVENWYIGYYNIMGLHAKSVEAKTEESTSSTIPFYKNAAGFMASL